MAAPQRLDCKLTEIDAKTGQNYDSHTENRSISIVYDEQANTLAVYQNAQAQPLNNVTFSVSAIDGYVKGMSLGLDRSDNYVTFQTYNPDTTLIETGTCSPSSQALPAAATPPKP